MKNLQLCLVSAPAGGGGGGGGCGSSALQYLELPSVPPTPAGDAARPVHSPPLSIGRHSPLLLWRLGNSRACARSLLEFTSWSAVPRASSGDECTYVHRALAPCGLRLRCLDRNGLVELHPAGAPSARRLAPDERVWLSAGDALVIGGQVRLEVVPLLLYRDAHSRFCSVGRAYADGEGCCLPRVTIARDTPSWRSLSRADRASLVEEARQLLAAPPPARPATTREAGTMTAAPGPRRDVVVDEEEEEEVLVDSSLGSDSGEADETPVHAAEAEAAEEEEASQFRTPPLLDAATPSSSQHYAVPGLRAPVTITANNSSSVTADPNPNNSGSGGGAVQPSAGVCRPSTYNETYDENLDSALLDLEQRARRGTGGPGFSVSALLGVDDPRGAPSASIPGRSTSGASKRPTTPRRPPRHSAQKRKRSSSSASLSDVASSSGVGRKATHLAPFPTKPVNSGESQEVLFRY